MVGKLKMEKDGYDIPLEIQEEIMKRLPVKSLFRFRLVSKPWNSLIHSSKFIRDYRAQPRLLVCYRSMAEDLCESKYVSIVDDDILPRKKLYLTVPTIDFFAYVVKTSSHGLLCYYKRSENLLFLWNPTIRKRVFIDVLDDMLGFGEYAILIGLGVCPSTYDPKVVKIICNRKLMENCSVEVFTLSSGVWRSPRSNLPRKSIFFTQNQVYVDGCIYWSAYYDSVRLPNGFFRRFALIMSFCVTSEEFTEICYPDSLALKDGIKLSISKLRESLLAFEINGTHTVYGVWMMTIHGDPNSFTKLYNINLGEALLKMVFGFSNSGKALVGKIEGAIYALSVYDLNSKHISSLIGFSQYSHLLSSYTETLLLLDH